MWVIAALLFFQAAGTGADGLQALDQGNYDAAVRSFQAAIAADPSDYTAHFNLALAYGFLHRDADGIVEYLKTLELKPGLYEAQLNASILLLRQKMPAEALPLIEAAAAQKPAEFRPLFYLAEAQLTSGAPAKAEENYRKAAELDPKSAGAQLGLARALAAQGKTPDAAPYFRRAADLDPAYRDSLLELAGLYEKNRQFAEAIEIYKQFPQQPAARERLGLLLMQTQQYAEAIPELEESYKQAPSKANRVALAAAYVFHNEPEKALPLYEKAVAEDPGNFDLHHMYAQALRDRKQFAASAAEFSAAAKLKPDDAHTWNELGGVLYLADSLAPALEALERADHLGEGNAGNCFLRGIILDKLQQKKPALEAYQRFLALSDGKNPNQEFQARQRAKLLERELGKK
jgi:tetratricopeptide (TPR) repeat protein